MYDDNHKLCDCEVSSNCPFDLSRCSCTKYCELYARQMEQYASPAYITISPRPSGDSYKKIYDEWRGYFYKMRKHLNNGVFVLELAGIRPHFHAIVDIKDRIGFMATLHSWSQYHNVKKHNKYKKGYHYLFKDIQETKDSTGLDPIYTYNQMITEQEEKHKQKCLQRLKDKQDKLYITNNSIPEWMRGDVEETD